MGDPRLLISDDETISLLSGRFPNVVARCDLTHFANRSEYGHNSATRFMVCVEPGDLNKDLRSRLGARGLHKTLDSIMVINPAGQGCSPRALSSGWCYLEELALEGNVRQLGVTDFGELALKEFMELVSVPPAFNCLELNPYCQAKSLRKLCADLGIAVHATYWDGPRSISSGLALEQEPTLRDIACRLGSPMASILLAWALQCASGIHITSDQVEWASSLSEGDLPLLTDDDLNVISDLDCEWRIQRDHNQLSMLFGTGTTDISVKPRDTSDLEYGLYRNMYLPLTPSMAVNRQVSHFLWRWVFNLPASVSAVIKPDRCSPLAKRLADELRCDGIAVTSVSEIDMLDQLQSAVAVSENLKVEVAKQESDCPQKDYRYYAACPATVDFSNAPMIREAVCSYLGLSPVVKNFQISVIPARRKGPVKQQHWHTDVEDFSLVKIVVYLNDVRCPEDGPVSYVRGSHPFGCYGLSTAALMRTTFVRDPEPGIVHVIPDRDFFGSVSPNLVSEIYGPAGTVILMDPRGFHKGGHALRQPRAVVEGTLLAPHQIHPLPGAPSLWRYLLFPFRWKNCLSKYRSYPYGTPSFSENISELVTNILRRVRYWPSVKGPR